jgi:hypothetical protein
MRTTLLTAVLLALLSYAEASRGDANDGELFGYSLGTRYSEQQDEQIVSGKLLLLAARDPVKPAAIAQVFVLISPISHSIGRIAGETWYESGEDALVAYEQFRIILRKKYSNWESEEQTRQQFHASRFWSGDYELSVRVSGPHSENPNMPPNKTFQFLITIIYKPGTTAASEFESMANAEIKQSAMGNFSEDEVRGL